MKTIKFYDVEDIFPEPTCPECGEPKMYFVTWVVKDQRDVERIGSYYQSGYRCPACDHEMSLEERLAERGDE